MAGLIASLDREMRVSALVDGDGIFDEIQVIKEFRRVGRDTVIVGGPLPFQENVHMG